MEVKQNASLSLQDIEYEIVESPRGVLRRYVYPQGSVFEEYTSHLRILGIPFFHRTRGKSPETGRSVPARGIIAIGRSARGVLAIGQLAIGVIAIGQLALGLLFGLGQAATGFVSIGQLAIAGYFCVAQFGLASRVIAQFGFGRYVMAVYGKGEHVWDTQNGPDPAVQQEFEWLFDLL